MPPSCQPKDVCSVRAKGVHDLLEVRKQVRGVRVQVHLVDLISEEHKVMSLTETHDTLHHCLIEQCARQVAWVDDDKRLERDVVPDGILDRSLDGRHRCHPLCVLVEVVRYTQAGVHCKRHCVQRVLWGSDI